MTRHRSRHAKTCHCQTKEKEVLSILKKSNEEEKKKKSNISISRITLYTQKIKFCMIFFFKKCLLEYENQFAVKKITQKNFGRNFKNTLKNFCRRHQKNASHTFSIYGNCMISVFFDKKLFLFSLLQYTEFYAKTREKFFENSTTPF